MAKAEAAIAVETIQIAQNKQIGLKQELDAVKHSLNQMKNPVRDWWRYGYDLAVGGSAVVIGGAVGTVFEPIWGDSLMAWGASTIAGHGYTGT